MNDAIFQPNEEMIALLVKLTDGQILEEEAMRLRGWVEQSQAAKRFYVDYISTHAMLQWHHGAVPTMATPGTLSSFDFEAIKAAPSPKPERKPLRIDWAHMAVAASVILALGMITLLFVSPPASPSVARVTGQIDAVWAPSTPAPSQGAALNQRLKLLSGLSGLEMGDGARVVVEGPCEFELTANDTITLLRGRLHAYVPPGSEGFKVLTAQATIVDLGTEFGVAVNETGVVEIHVFDGEVDIKPKGAPRASRIEGGFARSVAPGQNTPRPVALRETVFAGRRPAAAGLLGTPATPKKVDPANQPDRSPLLGLWNFDDTTEPGRSAVDHHIAHAATGRTTDGRTGKALMLDGKTEHLSIPSALSAGRAHFSIGFWVKTQVDTGSDTYWRRTTLAGQGIGGPDLGDFGITTQNGKLGYWSGLGRDLVDQRFESDTTINDGDWHLVVLTCDRTRTRLFLDGRVVPESERPAGLPLNHRSIWVGALSGRAQGTHHAGAVDDVAFWSQALTDAQIRTLFETARDPDLSYSTGQAQRLLDLVAGSEPGRRAMIGERTWGVIQGLRSEPGVVDKQIDAIRIRLGIGGQGVITPP